MTRSNRYRDPDVSRQLRREKLFHCASSGSAGPRGEAETIPVAICAPQFMEDAITTVTLSCLLSRCPPSSSVTLSTAPAPPIITVAEFLDQCMERRLHACLDPRVESVTSIRRLLKCRPLRLSKTCHGPSTTTGIDWSLIDPGFADGGAEAVSASGWLCEDDRLPLRSLPYHLQAEHSHDDSLWNSNRVVWGFFLIRVVEDAHASSCTPSSSPSNSNGIGRAWSSNDTRRPPFFETTGALLPPPPRTSVTGSSNVIIDPIGSSGGRSPASVAAVGHVPQQQRLLQATTPKKKRLLEERSSTNKYLDILQRLEVKEQQIHLSAAVVRAARVLSVVEQQESSTRLSQPKHNSHDGVRSEGAKAKGGGCSPSRRWLPSTCTSPSWHQDAASGTPRRSPPSRIMGRRSPSPPRRLFVNATNGNRDRSLLSADGGESLRLTVQDTEDGLDHVCREFVPEPALPNYCSRCGITMWKHRMKRNSFV